jgi:hypothetical protein
MEELNKIPLDNEARSGCNIPLETKIEIYDRKCAGCGFIRVEVETRSALMIFNNVVEAVLLAQRTGGDINRTCDYPGDVEMIHNIVVRPSLSEIISNTCRFWRKEGVEANEETLIEMGDYNEVQSTPDRQIPEYDSSGKIPNIKTFPSERIASTIPNESITAGVFRQET